MGCEEPAQRVVWFDSHEEYFYTCPMQFLTQDIIEWYTEYDYDTQIGTPLNYCQQSCKYIEAWRLYKMYVEKYKAYQLEKQTRHNKSGDALDAMAANLMAQKRNANG